MLQPAGDLGLRQGTACGWPGRRRAASWICFRRDLAVQLGVEGDEDRARPPRAWGRRTRNRWPDDVGASALALLAPLPRPRTSSCAGSPGAPPVSGLHGASGLARTSAASGGSNSGQHPGRRRGVRGGEALRRPRRRGAASGAGARPGPPSAGVVVRGEVAVATEDLAPVGSPLSAIQEDMARTSASRAEMNPLCSARMPKTQVQVGIGVGVSVSVGVGAGPWDDPSGKFEGRHVNTHSSCDFALPYRLPFRAGQPQHRPPLTTAARQRWTKTTLQGDRPRASPPGRSAARSDPGQRSLRASSKSPVRRSQAPSPVIGPIRPNGRSLRRG